MIKDDGTVIHFNNPKVQASLSANTFAITGHAETKQLTEMLPGILSQLGADSLTSLRKLAEQYPRQGACWRARWHTNAINGLQHGVVRAGGVVGGWWIATDTRVILCIGDLAEVFVWG